MSENDIKDTQKDNINKELLISDEKASNDSNPENVESGNIFDDFSTDSNLVEDVEKAKNAFKKDTYYYLILFKNIFQVIFILLFLVCIFSLIYIYVQKSTKVVDNSFLDPFCFFVKNNNIELPEGTSKCSSISYTKFYYDTKLETLKSEQVKGILSNLIVLYEKNNFLKSKDITFLRVEGANRLKAIKVLEKFDGLKKDFLGVEKNKIQCGKMGIDAIEKTFTISCDAFSQSFENKGIVGFSGDPLKKDEYVSGTSISVANSFINYIEKNTTDFSVIDRQKIFLYENVLGDSEIGKTTGYTMKTSFEVTLKINF